jgi:hypothetical protein
VGKGPNLFGANFQDQGQFERAIGKLTRSNRTALYGKIVGQADVFAIVLPPKKSSQMRCNAHGFATAA